MKAIWFERFGSAAEVLQLGEQALPAISHGQVLVQLEASCPNPSDVKKRAGSAPDLLDAGLVIPHSDGAGRIVEVGPGVSAARIGERVWVYQAQFQRQWGTAAEYVSVDEDRAVWLPDHVDFAIGACMGIPAMTAHRCVFADGSVEGQTVLVTGGAGGVGYYAVQWAKLGGAHVIATASDEASSLDCAQAGADVVVNHRDGDYVELVCDQSLDGAVDRIIEVDFGSNLEANLDMLQVGGTIATYASGSDPQPRLPFYRLMYLDATLRLVIVYDMPEEAKIEAIEDISEALEQGRLLHRVAHRVPLAETARAHELIEQGGFRGCVVVECTR
jgi:NADPH2:quinone reductase